jgi:hypothetical protein
MFLLKVSVKNTSFLTRPEKHVVRRTLSVKNTLNSETSYDFLVLLSAIAYYHLFDAFGRA